MLLKMPDILDNNIVFLIAINETFNVTLKLSKSHFFFCSFLSYTEMFIQLKNQNLVAFFGLFF